MSCLSFHTLGIKLFDWSFPRDKSQLRMADDVMAGSRKVNLRGGGLVSLGHAGCSCHSGLKRLLLAVGETLGLMPILVFFWMALYFVCLYFFSFYCLVYN